jgi:hypothetical protein
MRNERILRIGASMRPVNADGVKRMQQSTRERCSKFESRLLRQSQIRRVSMITRPLGVTERSRMVLQSA